MNKDSLLPDNRTALETALEKTIRDLIAEKKSPFPNLWRPDDIDIEHLPWLAEAMGAEEWDSLAPEEELRSTLLTLWPQKRQAGLRVSIRKAIEPLGFFAELHPWYQTAGSPYTLTAVCWSHDRPLTDEINNRLFKRITQAVSERDEIIVKLGRQLTASTNVVSIIHIGKTVVSYAYHSSGNASFSDQREVIALHLAKTITCYPESI